MGKGKGKKGKKEPRSAANKIPQAAKVRAPRPVNPIKKAKKLLSKEKKEAMYNPPLGADMETIAQLAHDRVMKNLVHAKWPSLFKKHLGVIESHIKALDRVMRSMQTQMEQMSQKERMEWELGERGNWRVMCEMMDRARQVLADAKKSAEGILPPERLKDKKGLGVTGTTFEPLGPKLAEKAAALGYTKKGKLGRNPDATSTDSENDTEISDSSSSDDDVDAVTNGVDFVPLNIGAKVPRFPIVEDSGEDKEKTTTNGVEPNPYFVVDTKPTPVVLNGNGVLKSKKRAKEDDGEGKKSKKAKKEKPTASEALIHPPAKPEVDFIAAEAALRAEVEAAEAAKAQEAQSAKSSEDKKSKKKRRRSSDGVELVEKKKVKKSKKVEDVPAANTTELPAEETAAKDAGTKRKLAETGPGDDDIGKKHKKDKKEKKRKADADGADDDQGNKKRKQKVAT